MSVQSTRDPGSQRAALGAARSALLAFAAALFILGACEITTPARLAFIGESRVVPSIEGTLLETRLTVLNHSQVPQILHYGGCRRGSALRLYRPDRSVAWDGWGVPEEVCSAELLELVLAPGATHEFNRDYRVEELLGDSLPPGRYRVTLKPDFIGRGDAEIEVGTWTLSP